VGSLGYERIIVCDNRGQAERLEELLGDDLASIEVGSIVAGFVLPAAKLAVFTDRAAASAHQWIVSRQWIPPADRDVYVQSVMKPCVKSF
jgi:hypothetical protein